MSDKPQIDIVLAHSLVEANGKTIRQNNLEKQHRLQEGQEVRVYTCDGEDDPPGTIDHVHDDQCASHVAFILHCGRDCDGTPLYWIGGLAACSEMQARGSTHTFNNMAWRVFNQVAGGYGEEDVFPSDFVNEMRAAFKF